MRVRSTAAQLEVFAIPGRRGEFFGHGRQVPDGLGRQRWLGRISLSRQNAAAQSRWRWRNAHVRSVVEIRSHERFPAWLSHRDLGWARYAGRGNVRRPVPPRGRIWRGAEAASPESLWHQHRILWPWRDDSESGYVLRNRS